MNIGETVGAFTVGKARLSRYNDFAVDDTGAPSSCNAVYVVVMPRGTLATHANVQDLPAINSTLSLASDLRAESYAFACINENTGVWEVTVAYARTTADETEQEDTVRMTGRNWDVAESAVDLTADVATGAPLVNAAGDPFDSVPQRVVASPQVSFTRRESRNPAGIIALNGTINASPVTVLGVTFPKHCAKIKISVTDSMDETAGSLRYECTYTIAGRFLTVEINGTSENIGWDEVLIECGYSCIENGAKVKMLEEDENGEMKELSSPKLLNADGTRNDSGTPVARRVVSCIATNWASLRLPG